MTPLILLAEDEPVLRQLMQMELRERGCEVEAVTNGEEVLAFLEEATPSLLLLDLLMPKLDGFEVLRTLAAKGVTFPVIILSNLGSPEDKQKCQQMGAAEFIVKNEADPEEIWEKVKEYV